MQVNEYLRDVDNYFAWNRVNQDEMREPPRGESKERKMTNRELADLLRTHGDQLRAMLDRVEEKGSENRKKRDYAKYSKGIETVLRFAIEEAKHRRGVSGKLQDASKKFRSKIFEAAKSSDDFIRVLSRIQSKNKEWVLQPVMTAIVQTGHDIPTDEIDRAIEIIKTGRVSSEVDTILLGIREKTRDIKSKGSITGIASNTIPAEYYDMYNDATRSLNMYFGKKPTVAFGIPNGIQKEIEDHARTIKNACENLGI